MPSDSGLHRLPHRSYLGFVSVHWIHTINDRRTGWLNDRFHARFREALVHSLSRYAMSCPIYCLMPDHIHLIATGLRQTSDQRRFSRRLRADINQILQPVSLQKQAFDHVLREHERERHAFVTIAHYIFENPVRAGIVEHASNYPYSGAMVPGYFGLDPREDGYWERYWKVHNRQINATDAH